MVGLFSCKLGVGGNLDFLYHRTRYYDPYTAKFLTHDSLGINPGGGVIKRYEYDAYGDVHIMDSLFNPMSGSTMSNPYYFTGRRLDKLDGGDNIQLIIDYWLLIIFKGRRQKSE